MNNPTGYFVWSIKGKDGTNLIGFESITIARGVIMLTQWSRHDNANPMDAMVFKMDDIKDFKVVEIEEFRNSCISIGGV